MVWSESRAGWTVAGTPSALERLGVGQCHNYMHCVSHTGHWGEPWPVCLMSALGWLGSDLSSKFFKYPNETSRIQ